MLRCYMWYWPTPLCQSENRIFFSVTCVADDKCDNCVYFLIRYSLNLLELPSGIQNWHITEWPFISCSLVTPINRVLEEMQKSSLYRLWVYIILLALSSACPSLDNIIMSLPNHLILFSLSLMFLTIWWKFLSFTLWSKMYLFSTSTSKFNLVWPDVLCIVQQHSSFMRTVHHWLQVRPCPSSHGLFCVSV